MRNRKKIIVLLTVGLLLSVYITAEAGQANVRQGVLGVSGGDSGAVSTPSVSTGDGNSQDDTLSDSTYYDALIAQELKEREYAIYNNQLKAQLSDFQIDYLTKLETELSEKYKIEKAKLDLGYTTSITVDEAHNQYTAAGFQIQTALAQQGLYKDVITLNGGEYKEIPLTGDLEALKGDFFTAFKENSVQLISYNQQILMAGNTQSAALLQLQKEQYEINLQIYVESLQIKYDDILRQITMLDNEIAVAENQIDHATALYEKGKVAAIRLKELETELSRLEYERMSFICDAKRIYYILTHTIEGQEVS